MISSVDYFNGLTEDLKEELHYKLKLENFEQGTSIFEAGESCKSIYFVVSGEIDLIIEKGSESEILLDTLHSGCSIGTYSFINETDFPYTAKARTNITILVLNK